MMMMTIKHEHTHDINGGTFVIFFSSLLTSLLIALKLGFKDFELNWHQVTAPSWVTLSIIMLAYSIAHSINPESPHKKKKEEEKKNET
jgi:hypothetical protein